MMRARWGMTNPTNPMPPATATMAPTKSAWMKNRICRSRSTLTPRAAAVSGPAAMASSGLDMNMRMRNAASTTRAGSNNLSHWAPTTEPSIQNITPCAARASWALNTRKLARAENADDATTPVKMRRSGVSPPCARVMRYTMAVAASAPKSAPTEIAYRPNEVKTPMVMTAVAPTDAPDDTPKR